MSSTCIITPELVSAAPTEPVTLTELKVQVRQDFSDDDTYLTVLGIAARQWFENALDRQLVTQTWKVRMPYFPAWEFELPYPPLQSISSITYKDADLVSQTVSAASYNAVINRTPGLVQLKDGYSWPDTGIDPYAVTVTFIAGYGAASSVPELVKEGIKLLAGHWYENREAVNVGNIVTDFPLAVDAIVQTMRAYRF